MANILIPNTAVGQEPQTTNRKAMAMVTMLFFMWGFLTVLNDILVPHLKAIFSLNYAQVMLVNSAFFGSYFTFAIPCGKLVEWAGYKRTIVIGLLVMAAGALLFVPAANAASFGLFLAALIVLAAGMTALQVSANPYVAILGPARTASSRLNLTQAFNSLGTAIAPYLGSRLILAAAPLPDSEIKKLSAVALQIYREQQASSVKLPYLGFTAVLLLMALALAIFHLPKVEATKEFHPVSGESGSWRSLWKHHQLTLGVLGIFLYVGAEVSIGSFLANYLNQPNIGNLSIKVAASYVSFYWLGAMIGRFVGSAVLQKAGSRQVLVFAAIAAFILVTISMSSFGGVAMWSIILVGLFNSIMFPTIFTLGIEGLGPLTGKGSGLLIMACVGGGCISVLQGALADRIGIHHAFILPALCYIYIVFYGYWGSRPKPTALPAAA